MWAYTSYSCTLMMVKMEAKWDFLVLPWSSWRCTATTSNWFIWCLVDICSIHCQSALFGVHNYLAECKWRPLPTMASRFPDLNTIENVWGSWRAALMSMNISQQILTIWLMQLKFCQHFRGYMYIKNVYQAIRHRSFYVKNKKDTFIDYWLQ